jgi:hypothetical protein
VLGVRSLESKVRLADIHVVICQVKARVSRARSGERANQQFQDVLRAAVCLSASVPAFFSRHEVSLLPIHGKQICEHLPRYGKCRPIAISFLLFLVINHSQFVALSRRQLGGFYQRTLDMFIALLRERHAHRLVGRAPFLSAGGRSS